MLPCTEFSSGSSLEQLKSEEPNLDSKVIRLMITTDIPHREEAFNGSRFIECMDYSITSFEIDPRVKKASTKLMVPPDALASPTIPPAPASHPISRGFGGFVRKLSLRAPPKRDLALSSPPGLLNLQLGSQNSSFGSAVNLCRKKSDKRPRPISALVIEPEKNQSWRAGCGKKSFTASCSLNSTPSPLSSLSSSTSSSSTHSKVLKTRQVNQDSPCELGLGRPMVQRSSSTTQIHIPQPISVRSMSTSSTNTTGQTFEVLSRSLFMRRKTNSSRHEVHNGKHLTPASLSILSKSTPLPRRTSNSVDQT